MINASRPMPVLDAESNSKPIGINLQTALDTKQCLHRRQESQYQIFEYVEFAQMHSGTVWAAVQLFGRHGTWQEQGLYHVGGRHTTWQEQDLAHGGGRHCHLAGTGLGSCWWQAHYLARTGAWFMLVAATTTWQLLGSCWWQAQYSVGERLHCWVQVRSLFFQKRFRLQFWNTQFFKTNLS